MELELFRRMKIIGLPVSEVCHHSWPNKGVLQPKLWPWEEWLSSFSSCCWVTFLVLVFICGSPCLHFTISHTRLTLEGPSPPPVARPRVICPRLDSHHHHLLTGETSDETRTTTSEKQQQSCCSNSSSSVTTDFRSLWCSHYYIDPLLHAHAPKPLLLLGS